MEQPNQIGKYQVLTELGQGSMGVVYRAEDPEIGRILAIKTLRSIYLGDDTAGNEALQRFRQESRSAGRLRHPNIVTIFEAGRSDEGSPFIAMEFIEGRSLEAIIEKNSPLDPLEALHYLAQVADAIDYAHSEDVIHRDIKPSNFLIDSQGKPKLLDFGVAKLSDTSLTPAGTVVGTPSYMSPEQIRGDDLDGRTDLFSLAVVAFELFCGERPFPGKDFTTVVGNIIHKQPLSFSEINCDLPKELEAVFHRGLAKDRGERFKNATDFVNAVAEPFSLVVNSAGLVGGYTPGKRFSDLQRNGAAETLISDIDIETESENLETEEDDLEIEDTLGVAEELFGSEEATDEFQPPSNSGAKTFFLGTVSALAILSYLVFFSESKLGALASSLFSEEQTEEAESIEVVQEIVALDTLKAEEFPNLNDSQLTRVLDSSELDPEILKVAVDEASNREGEEVWQALNKLLTHDDYTVRIQSLKSIQKAGRLTDEGFLPAVAHALNDKEWLVRGFAAKALAEVKDERTVKALEARAKVEDNKVVSKILADILTRRN